MLRRTLILSLSVMLGSAQTAQADATCDMVDRVLKSVSIIKDIEADTDNRKFTENMFKLEGLVESISVSELFPMDSQNIFPVENRAMQRYLASLQEAATAAESGYVNYSKQNLKNGLNPGFTRSIEALTTYWSCTVEDKPTQTEVESKTVKASFTAPGTPKVKTIERARPRQIPGQSSAGNRAANGGVLHQANLDRTPLLSGNTLMFYLILGVIGLAGLFFYVLKRSRRIRVREARRLVQLPVRVRLGKQDIDMTIVDISLNGLKMQHGDDIRTQAKLSVFLDGQWRAGKIMWSNSKFTGVKFKKPIDRQTFNAVME